MERRPCLFRETWLPRQREKQTFRFPADLDPGGPDALSRNSADVLEMYQHIFIIFFSFGHVLWAVVFLSLPFRDLYINFFFF